MEERTVVVTNPLGLHARHLTALARAVRRWPSARIVLEANGVQADPRSLFSLLKLKATPGTQVTIRASGEGAEEAVAELAALAALSHDPEVN